MGSSEFSFAQDGHEGWLSNLLFLPQWPWPQSTQMPQYMVTPPPQLMALLSLFITLPLSITLPLKLTTNLNLIISRNLCTMLHLFTTPYTTQYNMPLFIMHLPLIMSQNLIITNHQSAPLITPKHGVLKMLNTQLMRLSMLFSTTTRVSRLFTRMCSLILRTVLIV